MNVKGKVLKYKIKDILEGKTAIEAKQLRDKIRKLLGGWSESQLSQYINLKEGDTRDFKGEQIQIIANVLTRGDLNKLCNTKKKIAA